jgi:hypothetical protein
MTTATMHHDMREILQSMMRTTDALIQHNARILKRAGVPVHEAAVPIRKGETPAPGPETMRRELPSTVRQLLAEHDQEGLAAYFRLHPEEYQGYARWCTTHKRSTAPTPPLAEVVRKVRTLATTKGEATDEEIATLLNSRRDLYELYRQASYVRGRTQDEGTE